jgi:hypothetical protein
MANAWLTNDNELVIVTEYAGSSSLHKMCQVAKTQRQYFEEAWIIDKFT